MAGERNDVHVDTNEARGGSTPGVVRWILAISLIAAIVLLSAVWIFGAASQTDDEGQASVSERTAAQQDRSETDGLVSDEFDETDNRALDDPLNMPNKAADEQ